MSSDLRRARRTAAAAVVAAGFAFPYTASAETSTRGAASADVITQLAAPAAATAGAPATVAQALPGVPAAPAAAPGANAPQVVSVDVSGNAHVPTDKILSVVRTRVGQPFDERMVREDLQNIYDLGFFSDQVPPLIRQRPDGIAITFRVIENPVIQRIVFTGDEHVPADTLLALMDTAVGQVLNSNTFHQDVLKINSYYDKIGYSGQLPTHVTGINISPTGGVLTITIREGLTVSGVEFSGNRIIPDPVLLKSISLKVGVPYSDEAHDKDYESLKKLYEQYDLELGDFEVGIDPTTIDTAKGTAKVKYSIYVATVGAVQITGNTLTKDVVVRRQLRLRPGMVITQGMLKRDDERLQNLGFFEKVDLNPKPGPDPKKPYEITLDWNVKEQRTGTAQIGAGYSGGPTGQGLTGTLSYSQNNINGTGNGASIRLERGSRVSDASLSYTVPYLGNTPQSQRYSLGASVFTSDQTNFYQTYAASAATALTGSSPVVSTPSTVANATAAGAAQQVVLTPNAQLVNGIVANYGNRATGATVTVGRRISDALTATAGLTAQRLATAVTLPTGYALAGTQGAILNSPIGQSSLLGSSQQNTTTLGISAPSIADTSNGAGYELNSVTAGLQSDTRDDVVNPRHGQIAALTEELSGKPLGSSFGYTLSTLDTAKFLPVLKRSTLALHALVGESTGAIPPSKLFVLTDQQLRGYSQVFYGTQELLFQGELRVPLTPDRKFGLAGFFDYGGQRIRGAAPITDALGNVVVNYDKFLYRDDAGIGLRFAIPQLGFSTIRLDFARGAGGGHTSFGIGQSF